jgi:hypothetical protein
MTGWPKAQITGYSWFLVNSPLPVIRALPGMWPANFIGANPGQAGAYMPRNINFLQALAVYRPT